MIKRVPQRWRTPKNRKKKTGDRRRLRKIGACHRFFLLRRSVCSALVEPLPMWDTRLKKRQTGLNQAYIKCTTTQQRRLGMDMEPDDFMGRYVGVGISLGAAIGCAVGVAMDNFAMGIGLGVGLGSAIGAILARRRQHH
ncbi:hypothetical protein ACFFTM_00875 [Pseudoduganella plicata]|nr:hypothetical protein [Pseudoduganella plicata]